MDTIFTLNSTDELTDAQLRELEASRNFPIAGDEDSPLVDPDLNPDLWAKALEALARRNQEMARRMA